MLSQLFGGTFFNSDPASEPPIVPPGWAFSIWGLVEVLSLAYAIWALPAHRPDPELRNRLARPLVAVFAGFSLWLAAAEIEPRWSTLAVFLVMLGGLSIRAADRSRRPRAHRPLAPAGPGPALGHARDLHRLEQHRDLAQPDHRADRQRRPDHRNRRHRRPARDPGRSHGHRGRPDPAGRRACSPTSPRLSGRSSGPSRARRVQARLLAAAAGVGLADCARRGAHPADTALQPPAHQ